MLNLNYFRKNNRHRHLFLLCRVLFVFLLVFLFPKQVCLFFYKKNKDKTKYRTISSKGSLWWGIPLSMIPAIRFKRDASPYFLCRPGYVKVSTPSIVTGLSTYYPNDRLMLEQKAIYWRQGLLRNLLIKSKRCCKVCGCSISDPFENVEIHYVQPLSLKGFNAFTNLAALCRECHKDVSSAVQLRNIELVEIYESNRVLSNVSRLLQIGESSVGDTP